MPKTRFEEYTYMDDRLPFELHADIERSALHSMEESNWHENLEIQLCTGGSGTVFIDGMAYPFAEKDIFVVNSNAVHRTNSAGYLKYTALIIGSAFCRQVGIPYESLYFIQQITDPALRLLLEELQSTYLGNENYRTAKLHCLLLQILILLTENYAAPRSDLLTHGKSLETVQKAIIYIRKSYDQKILLEDIARHLYTDKFQLTREFKKATGTTIVSYINRFRCQKAAECIIAGYTVTEAAEMCGFFHPSFFTKVFKQHMGKTPSAFKKALDK